MTIQTVTSENFDQVVAEHDLVVVDFWAEWCAPCLSFNPVLERVAERYPDVAFAKVDIEDQTDLAKEFDVQSVPAVLILRSQVVVYAQTGALPANALIELIEQAKSLDPSQLDDQG